MRIVYDNPEVRRSYNELLEQSPNATVYQTMDWLSAFASLACDLVFVETDSGDLIPFVCKGVGAFRRAFSLPYDTYGGPVTGGNGSSSYDEIIRVLNVPSARVVDYTSSLRSSKHHIDEVRTHIVDLSDGYERVAERYADMNRRAIRQAQNRGVSIERVASVRRVADFYQLYRKTIARYRTPPLPLRFFESVFETMAADGMATFYLATYRGDAVAANLVLRFRGKSYDWTWGYDDRYLQLRPTNALIDHAIRQEIDAGSRELNLGASPPNSNGNVQFKENFGATLFSYQIVSKIGFAYQAARSIKHRGIRLATR